MKTDKIKSLGTSTVRIGQPRLIRDETARSAGKDVEVREKTLRMKAGPSRIETRVHGPPRASCSESRISRMLT